MTARIIFNRATANVASPAFQSLPGGDYQCCPSGVYNGATMTLRFSDSLGNTLPVDTDFTFTADTAPFIFTAGEGGGVGGTISSVGASTDLSLVLLPVPRK